MKWFILCGYFLGLVIWLFIEFRTFEYDDNFYRYESFDNEMHKVGKEEQKLDCIGRALLWPVTLFIIVSVRVLALIEKLFERVAKK